MDMNFFTFAAIVLVALTSVHHANASLGPGQRCCACSSTEATVLLKSFDGTCALGSREVASCDMAAEGMYCIEEMAEVLISEEDLEPSASTVKCVESPCPVARPVKCEPPKIANSECECECPACPAGTRPIPDSDGCACTCPEGMFLTPNGKCSTDACDACPRDSVCMRGKQGKPAMCRDCDCGFCDDNGLSCCKFNGINNCRAAGGGNPGCQLNEGLFPGFADSGNACSGVEISATATENGCGCKPNSETPCTFRAGGRGKCRICRAKDLGDAGCQRCKDCLDRCGAAFPFARNDKNCRNSCTTACFRTD